MPETHRRMIPDWAWAVLAIAVMGLTFLLFMTDRTAEPGDALLFDVSEYEVVDEEDVRYRETARITLALDAPAGLAVDAEGRIWATGDDTLLMLDGTGRELARHDIGGRPECIAVAPDGTVFLGMRDHVTVFSATGEHRDSWESLGERAWLTEIAADETHVYVADAGNLCVYRYTHDGRLLNVIGERDPDAGIPGIVVPSPHLDVALDAMGALWVVNPGRLGVEKYRDDGALLTAWYQPGFGLHQFPGCCNPIHIAFKSNGTLVTAEKGLNRVKVFTADRSFAGIVAPPAHVNAGWNAADFPRDVPPICDLAVDNDDRILVLHGPLRAILVFEPIDAGKENE